MSFASASDTALCGAGQSRSAPSAVAVVTRWRARRSPYASKPKAALKRKRGAEPTETKGTHDWPAGCIGFEILRTFADIKAKAKAKELVYVRNGKFLQARAPSVGDFTGMVQVREGGASAGVWDPYIEVEGAAALSCDGPPKRKGLRLRSVEDIVRFFAKNPHLNSRAGSVTA